MISNLTITSAEPFADGAAFGETGAYERVTAIAEGEVDPGDPRNRTIVNLDKAPQNARGHVSYRCDVFLLRPMDSASANGALLYEVNNRGMKLLMGALMGAVPRDPALLLNDPRTAEDAGDALLLKQGYTIAWSGWDPNAPRANAGLGMTAPVALEAGKPVEGMVRDEFFGGGAFFPEDVFRLSYPVADPATATLSMRWRESEARVPVPRARWAFVNERTVRLLPEGTKPERGALYEMRYRAHSPQVAGLGFAAVRDVVSHLRRAPGIDRALAIGISQSGRFLRGFLHRGFNRDEENRRVFDGALAVIAGAGKVFLDAAFSQPFRTNTQHSDHLYPDFALPFTSAGILRGDGFDPKLMEVNTATEYWQKGASLATTTPDGGADAEEPAGARAYFLPGIAHANITLTPDDLAHPVNPLTSMFVLRALLAHLDAWAARGTPPPSSRVPRIADGTLVSPGRLRPPAIPGVAWPAAPNAIVRIADWVEPCVEEEPPYPVLVPQVDEDGIDRGGVRIPEVAVPLGTALGWNVYRAPELGGELGGLFGSFIPFARTEAERRATGDPRASLEERYESRDGYVARIRSVCDALASEGFLLREDVARIVARAETSARF